MRSSQLKTPAVSSKVSTDQCKKFIVEFVTQNPSLIKNIYGEPEYPEDQEEMDQLMQAALKPGNWSRTSRYLITSDSNNCPTNYDYNLKRDVSVDAYSVDRDGTYEIPIERITWVREFDLKPSEGAVAFAVLEDVDGHLHMGPYMGD
jgi:hypothetical protein